VEDLVTRLQLLDPLLIYAVVFAVAFVENLFPPSPSDLVVLFAGSLVGIGQVDFPAILLLATAGSSFGFVAAYKIGGWFGVRILEEGRIRFIPVSAVRRAEDWFRRYGYWVIVANRFLPGTRAVVSFFAGMSKLDLAKTAALSFVSALVWNCVLLGLGYGLGHNWREIGALLSTYSQVATIVVSLLLIAVILRAFLKKRRENKH